MHRQPPILDTYFNREIQRILNKYHPSNPDCLEEKLQKDLKAQLGQFSNRCKDQSAASHRQKKTTQALDQLRCSFAADILKDHNGLNDFLSEYYKNRINKENKVEYPFVSNILHKKYDCIRPDQVQKHTTKEYINIAGLLTKEAMELTHLELQRQAYGRTDRTSQADLCMTMANQWLKKAESEFKDPQMVEYKKNFEKNHDLIRRLLQISSHSPTASLTSQTNQPYLSRLNVISRHLQPTTLAMSNSTPVLAFIDPVLNEKKQNEQETRTKETTDNFNLKVYKTLDEFIEIANNKNLPSDSTIQSLVSQISEFQQISAPRYNYLSWESLSTWKKKIDADSDFRYLDLYYIPWMKHLAGLDPSVKSGQSKEIKEANKALLKKYLARLDQLKKINVPLVNTMEFRRKIATIITHHEYALLSWGAYRIHEQIRDPEQNTPRRMLVEPPDLGWSPLFRSDQLLKIEEKNIHYFGVAYFKPSANAIVIAHKGTNKFIDLIADAYFAFLKQAYIHFTAALAFTDALIDWLKDKCKNIELNALIQDYNKAVATGSDGKELIQRIRITFFKKESTSRDPMDIEQIIKLISQIRTQGLSISHTGHSLGALLAEFAAANYRDVAVTFDSPGSKEILNQLATIQGEKDYKVYNSLITTYFAEPNFINVTDKHVGTQLRIYPRKIYGDGFTPPRNRLEQIKESFEKYLIVNLIHILSEKALIKISRQSPIDSFIMAVEKLYENLFGSSSEIKWENHRLFAGTFINNMIMKIIDKKMPLQQGIANHIIAFLVSWTLSYISESLSNLKLKWPLELIIKSPFITASFINFLKILSSLITYVGGSSAENIVRFLTKKLVLIPTKIHFLIIAALYTYLRIKLSRLASGAENNKIKIIVKSLEVIFNATMGAIGYSTGKNLTELAIETGSNLSFYFVKSHSMKRILEILEFSSLTGFPILMSRVNEWPSGGITVSHLRALSIPQVLQDYNSQAEHLLKTTHPDIPYKYKHYDLDDFNKFKLYDLVLISVESKTEKTERLELAKKAYKTQNKNCRVLIRRNEEIYLYIPLTDPRQWIEKELDYSLFKYLIFPNLGLTKILNKEYIPFQVFQNLATETGVTLSEFPVKKKLLSRFSMYAAHIRMAIHYNVSFIEVGDFFNFYIRNSEEEHYQDLPRAYMQSRNVNIESVDLPILRENTSTLFNKHKKDNSNLSSEEKHKCIRVKDYRLSGEELRTDFERWHRKHPFTAANENPLPLRCKL